jgi:3-hydroxyacyl-CoA dehydrogenase/enoyl-CoA hydratase/3-hydroxybutyryl-CoA epimerase
MTLQNFRFEVDGDGIALVTFDMPGKSMNVLSQGVIDDIVAIAERVATDAAVKGAVITSGKDAFCAGADLSELGSLMGGSAMSEQEARRAVFAGAERLKAAFRKLETAGKPVVAAINGLALGGGFELTLACHYRIAADDAPGLKVGLPEAMIGVLPGGGGTQRLPRLIGAQEAFQLMLLGRQLGAKEAQAAGLVHETAPKAELVAKAKAWAKANPNAKAPWDGDKFRIPGGGPYHPAGIQVFGAASPMLRKNTWGNYPAQRYILSCVYEGLLVDIDTGLRIESRYFAKLMTRPEARNMIRSIFLSKQDLDKGGRRPAGQSKAPIKKVAVIGAGFMGAGIATVSAQAGIDVLLVDVDQAAAEKGKKHAADEYAKQVSRGRMDQAKADANLARITPTTDYQALKDVDLVVEAVFESSELKNKITQAAEAVMPATAVFGSNTSTIPITSLATASKRPKEFIGIHFFSPVEKMMLVEIIVGKKTSDHAISRAIDFVTAIRKTPIVVGDARGFYANRCVMRYIEQGMAMLADGYLPALIENGARAAGMPVGPLSLQDEVAIDLGHKILMQTKKDLGEAYVPGPTDPILERMMALGRHGRKNAKGFYDYPADGKKRLWSELGQFAVNGVLPDDQQPDVQLVKDRVLYAQAIEAARTVQEKIVSDPREADVGSILGWGFAPYTGGVLSFIDTIGAEAFVKRAGQLARAHGEPFKVPKILRDIAKDGSTFYSRAAAPKAAA